MDAFLPSALPAMALGDFIRMQVAGGVQGIVVGEDHRQLGLPRMLAAEMRRFKQAGIQTFFTEHVAADRQPMLDAALAGRPEAQHELYMYMLGNWHNDEAATARYDLLFAAHAAGLRVIGANTSETGEHLQMGDSGANDMRMTLGDAYMAREILRQHGKAPFLMLAGSNHVGDPGGESLQRSGHGSIDMRLNAAGITTIGLVLEEETESGADLVVRGSPGSRVFSLVTSEDMAGPVRRASLTPRILAGLEYLRRVSGQLLAESDMNLPREQQEMMERQLQRAHDAFNKCASPAQVRELYQPVRDLLEQHIPADTPDNAAYYLRSAVGVTGRMLDNLALPESQAQEHSDFCSPAAAKNWLRPGAGGKARLE